MSPEQARRIYEAMNPETKARFREFVTKVIDVATRLDDSLTNMGQAMADEVEAWVNEEQP